MNYKFNIKHIMLQQHSMVLLPFTLKQLISNKNNEN